jgi:thiamine biosynthesis protein ThiI
MKGYDFVVIHYAEIGIKGKNRVMFEDRLVRNMRSALEGLEHGPVKRVPGRVLLKLSEKSDYRKIEAVLKRVFGIAHFSPAWSCASGMKDIERKALEVMKGRKGSFRVTATRSWKGFRTGSQQVNEKVGETVVKRHKLKVKLTGPANSLFIEILEKSSFLYTEKTSGPGGLPVGVSGKVVCLLSGGIDSPVAGWNMMKRGCEVVFVHFYNEAMGGIRKVGDLLETLRKHQPGAKLYVVPFRKLQNEVIAKVPARWRMILYRRFMYRIAEGIARKEGAKALATGESLAQVASQTLDNLGVIQEAADMPVLRPLLGYDKAEIIGLAKRIGTYETSIKPYQDCCSFMIAKHPVTRARPSDMERVEAGLDVAGLVKGALAGAEVFKHGR